MTEQFEHINVTGLRARRLTYERPRTAILEETQIQEAGENDVILKTLFSGISRGTESLVFAGKVPASEWQRMRCPHMHGEFSFPLSYGYSCVAEVQATGAKVRNLSAGDRVFVLHPHQDLMTVNADVCVPIPGDIPSKRAVLAANMETAINAVWDAQIENGQITNCAVVGGGVVGLLTAVALRQLSGIEPLIIDIDPEKQITAASLGFKCVTPAKFENLRTETFDVSFNTSASAAGLQFAIDNSGFEGKVIEMSWFGDNPVSVNLGGIFHVNRLNIISSQVGNIAKIHRHKLSFADRLRKALSSLEDNRLDVLLEEPIDFQSLPDHLENILNSSKLCQVIRYS